jgi:acyl-CoA reductase-like NAD-dependent aldehyde dehydrogenase
MYIINPSTATVVAEVVEDTNSTINDKYKTACAAQARWAQVPVAARLEVLARFSQLLQAEADLLANTLSTEMGKPLAEAKNELRGASERIAFFLNQTEACLQPEQPSDGTATQGRITYEPLGVIANISAWNYPYLVGVNVFVPALMAGNAVLYKPSEYTTLTGLHLADLWTRAGLPEGCFGTIVGGAPAGEALLDLPLNGYFFTGSFATGQHIAQRVAPKLVPLGLELGGKDPLYVADDVADLHQTAAAVLEGAFYNNGQSCCAVERVYVHEAIYEPFIAALASAAHTIRVGSPLDGATTHGPLSRKAQVAFLQGQLEDALLKGANICWQYRGDLPAEGYFFRPVVLSNVHHGMRLMVEESFGPIVGIQCVASDQAAADLMQDTAYGLTASVYSSSAARAESLLAQMRTGTVYWNCCDRVTASLPWSGRGHSGLGSTLGTVGIRAFTQPKAWQLRQPGT